MTNTHGKTISLYVVTDEEHLYCDRVGSVIWEDRTRVYLDFGDDVYLLERHEVERII
ncbi:hypothetical protein P9E76_01610 [Schinkia azotoformans]|uniref:hypothetical protein n=1 Tax=Schinkia azotoformans TaxID=1454 RepID=UPI0002DFBE9B|nr:hypothetical protein [Schinkia azotoformans]MEC1637371.1 hypothetical protein [Schinkia azotoformans]MEC1943775.1 hypothetical protein [Schinkia azotoformans]